MKDLSKIAISLCLLSQQILAYREFDINKNPFVCLNECSEDDSPQSHQEKHHLKQAICPDGDHRVTSLPYWDGTKDLPCMYAGTLNVSRSNDEDHNLFYWHFKNTALENAPLVVWINGGPGSSSMFGLFLENGPIRLGKNGPGEDDYILSLNPDGSWVDIADMVFIDQPVGTGFSYGNTYLDRMEDGATEFVSFLVAFLKMYPEYKNRNVVLSGESYAGKYLPHFATRVSRHNNEEGDNVPKDQQVFINLVAVLIGDPFVSPVRQRTSTHIVAQGLNVIDGSNMGQVSALRKLCEESISNNWNLGSQVCGSTMDYIDEIAGGLFTYDGSIFDQDWNVIGDPVDYFLANCSKRDELYKAIHIDKSTKVPVYEPSSQRVADAYDFEEMLDWTCFYDAALSMDGNVGILVYAGEFDQRDGPATQDAWMKDLIQLDRSNKIFFEQSRKIYYVKDPSGNFQVGGYFRYDPLRQFTFLAIPKAGHFVPTTQLMVTKQILSDYIGQNHRLECHKDKPEDCETAPIMCRYMNNCNNNGQCLWNGKCKCNDGFKGADCSEQVEILTNGYQNILNLNGTQWFYFQYNGGLLQNQSYEWTLSSQFAMDVYISRGAISEPTEFKNDLEFRKQSYLKFSSTSFPSFSRFVAAVRVNGIEFNGNVYHQSQLRSSFTKKESSQMVDQFEYLEMQPLKQEPGMLDKVKEEWDKVIDWVQPQEQAEGGKMDEEDDVQGSSQAKSQSEGINIKFEYFILGLIGVFGFMIFRNKKKVNQ